MASKGIPIGRPAEVNLRNNHAQYIFTWYALPPSSSAYLPLFITPVHHFMISLTVIYRYGLAIATSIMFYMVVKKPPTDISRRVRLNKEWS